MENKLFVAINKKSGEVDYSNFTNNMKNQDECMFWEHGNVHQAEPHYIDLEGSSDELFLHVLESYTKRQDLWSSVYWRQFDQAIEIAIEVALIKKDFNQLREKLEITA